MLSSCYSNLEKNGGDEFRMPFAFPLRGSR